MLPPGADEELIGGVGRSITEWAQKSSAWPRCGDGPFSGTPAAAPALPGAVGSLLAAREAQHPPVEPTAHTPGPSVDGVRYVIEGARYVADDAFCFVNCVSDRIPNDIDSHPSLPKPYSQSYSESHSLLHSPVMGGVECREGRRRGRAGSRSRGRYPPRRRRRGCANPIAHIGQLRTVHDVELALHRRRSATSLSVSRKSYSIRWQYGFPV